MFLDCFRAFNSLRGRWFTVVRKWKMSPKVACQNIEMLAYFKVFFLRNTHATPLYVAKYLRVVSLGTFMTWKQPLQPSCGTSVRNLRVHIDHPICPHSPAKITALLLCFYPAFCCVKLCCNGTVP